MTRLLVGRQVEAERLGAWASAAATGRGTVVLVEGESGIGKTTLLDVVAARCDALGIRTCRGAAEHMEQRLPFAAMSSCLGLRTAGDDPELARIAGLLRGAPTSGRVSAAAGNEFVVNEAILDLVDKWCAERTVALIVDDVQWIDPASAVVLNRLARGIGQQRLLLVIASQPARDEAAAGLVRGLLSTGAYEQRLVPLDEPSVVALVESELAAPPGPRLLRLATGAGGNPLYVVELVRALVGEGKIGTVGGLAEVSEDVDRGPDWMPEPLVKIILRRVDALPHQARDLLQMAAALGPVIDVTELSTVLEVPVGEMSEAMVTALESGLLVDSGGDLVFRHELIRAALAEHLPVALRTALHQRAAHVLADADAPVERVAQHLLAGTAIEHSITVWLEQVADELIVRAPGLAVSLLTRALSSVEGDAAHRLRFHLVRAFMWAGRHVEAERSARAALVLDPGPGRKSALWWLLAQICYRQGRMSEVVAVAGEAVASGHLHPDERGRLEGFSAIALFHLDRFDDAEAAAEKALVAGTTEDDANATGLGYLALAALRFAQGDMARALEYDERALAAFGQGVQPDLQVDPYSMRGYCLLELNRLAEADEALAIALRHNLQTGGAYLATCYALRARLRTLDGRWDDALAEIQAGMELDQDPLSQRPSMQGLAAMIAVHRGGQPDLEALPVAENTIGGRKYGYLTRWARALGQESSAGPRQALDLLYPVWEHAWGMGTRRVTFRICADLARFAATAGDTERARALAASTEKLAADEPRDSLLGTAQLCRGLADDGPDTLLAAARSFHAAGWPYYEAQGYENAASVLARSGRTAEARTALDRTVALYTALGATWDIARAKARLRQAGVRRGVHGPRRRPKTGWAALTATEREVAQLVAEGRSNPDIAAHMFLSRRTVQSHVSSILAKLSLHSRVELAITAVHRTQD